MRRAFGVLGLGLLACVAHTGTAPSSAPKPPWKRSCTEYAEAPVSIEYQDAPGGAAVVYRTRGDVRALRQRTHDVAAFHNSSASKVGALHDLYAIPHRAYAEDIADGAKLILVAKGVGLSRLAMLRAQVQQETFTLRRRGCGAGQEAL